MISGEGETHDRYYCPTCKRPLELMIECLHGLALAPEPWTGELDSTPGQLAEMYPKYYDTDTKEANENARNDQL